MQFITYFKHCILLLIYTLLYTNVTLGAAPIKNNSLMPQALNTKVKKLLNMPENEAAQNLTTLLSEHPELICTAITPGQKNYKGLSFAHNLINQRKLFLVHALVKNTAEDLSSQVPYIPTQNNERFAGTTPFLALCLQDLDNIELQVLRIEIARMVLPKNPNITTLKRCCDDMSPMLAAAANHNFALLELIGGTNANVFNDVTKNNLSVALIPLYSRYHYQTQHLTVLAILRSAAHLFNSQFILQLIRKKKRKMLEGLSRHCERFPQLNETVLQNIWNDIETDPSPDLRSKIRMHIILKKMYPSIKLRRVNTNVTTPSTTMLQHHTDPAILFAPPPVSATVPAVNQDVSSQSPAPTKKRPTTFIEFFTQP